MKFFFFGFIEAFYLKGILNTLKKELQQPWNALTLQLSLSLRQTNEIAVFVSLFLEKPLSLIYLQFCASIFCGFGHLKRIFLAVFAKRVKRFEEKLNIC